MTSTTPVMPAGTGASPAAAAASPTKRGAGPATAGAKPFDQALVEARASLEDRAGGGVAADSSGEGALPELSDIAPGGVDVAGAAAVPVPVPAQPAQADPSASPQPGLLPAGLPQPPALPLDAVASPAVSAVVPADEPSTIGDEPMLSPARVAAQLPTVALADQPAHGNGTQPQPLPGQDTMPLAGAREGSGIPQIASPAAPRTEAGAPEPVGAVAVSPGATATPAPAVVSSGQEARAAVQHLPLHEQVAPRLAGLRSLSDGTHRMTLRVEPEAIGPLRIVAEVRGEHVRVELMGVSELARDVLRSALPDLRRELAAAGMQAQLDLASAERDFGRDNSGGFLGDPTKAERQQNDVRDGVHVHEAEPVTSWTPTAGGRLDVLA